MATFDAETGAGDKPEPEEKLTEGMSAAQMIEAVESEGGMTEDELADLTYAFQAADMDGGGAIDSEEFQMMLTVMGCTISDEEVKQCMFDAKQGFGAWKKLADQENVEKCQRLWTEYDDDKSGTMDLREINNVITALQKDGFTAQPMTAEDMTKYAGGEGGEMDFDEFSAWILKQEGLPDSFGAPKDVGTAGLGGKKDGLLKKGFGALMMPLELTAKVAMGPLQLLEASVHLIPGSDHLPGFGDHGSAGATVQGSQEEIANALVEDEEEEIIFAEYVFLMRSGSLKQFLPGDWQERAEDMRKLREAFDTADVDGDNQLELEEFEMVIISMNPKADLSTEDIGKVWEVLNPEGKDWIPFSEFVAGMIIVKRDEELSNIMPMDVPNRFQLLSLLIDSPINEEQEELIFDKMSGLEKAGVNMLRSMEKPMDKSQIKETLQQACAGKLHYLTDVQRKSVINTHWWCVLQALFIGAFFTFWPGVFENYLVHTLETDGVVDAYWTCPQTIGDPTLAPWGTTEELKLAENSLTWTWLKDYGPVPKQGRCKAGTCVSIPENFTKYIALNGSTVSGGDWFDNDRDCKKDLISGVESCDDICTPLLKTLDHNREAMAMFWALNTCGIVLGIAFELSLLMYTAVRSAVRVSWALDLRLTPLNQDRAFVANMLVRAAFELGDPDDETMGVEAKQAGASGERPLWRNILTGAWIKGKVVITGTLFKQVVARTAAYDTATWLKPYLGTMFATAMWDSMMCHVIMKGAELRAIGVTTSVEVFNEIMDTFCPEYESNPSSLSELAREQILRAIGVAIVKHGAMFPTMEILLRHAVNYLNMKKSKAVRQSGIIDNEELFMETFETISLNESRAVLCTHMLCYVLDGSVGISELHLWSKLLHRVEDAYQAHRSAFDDYDAPTLRKFIIVRCPNLTKAVSRVPTDDPVNEMLELGEIAKSVPQPRHVTNYDQLIPRVVCQKFRNNEPVTTDMLRACFDPEEHKEFMAKTLTPKEITNFMRREAFYNLTMVLTGDIFDFCCD